MKHIVIIGIIIWGLLVGSLFHGKYVLASSTEHNTGDYVVLLHGLGRSSWSMQRIGKALEKQNFQVININYPTRSDSIQNLTQNHVLPTIRKQSVDPSKKIHVVTHSMGGMIVREIVEKDALHNIGNIVMLAPPNQGSEAADMWSDSWFWNRILGPSLAQMRTDGTEFLSYTKLSPIPTGIIAAAFDEKVSVERTKHADANDFLVLPEEHTFLMLDNTTIDNIIHFIHTGNF